MDRTEWLRERLKEVLKYYRWGIQHGNQCLNVEAMLQMKEHHEKAAILQIIQAFTDAGGVLLSDSQELPEFSPPFHIRGSAVETIGYQWFDKSQKAMLAAGWKRVRPI